VALFRAGHDEAFRVIHDRYRQRLFAYTRQMLVHRQDAEDALQDIFVRAYSALRASDRELALRAWLYRVAHNRCIDELRRPAPPPPEVLELLRSPVHDPIAEADRRESLRRLIADVRRLPDQQRSALLMRELSGMSYADMSDALGVTVPAVKSLLVRARLGLAQALEARDTACSEIREELIVSHEGGLRPNATARRHMRDCDGCREFRHQLRGVSRRFAAIVPTLGPLGVLANLLGLGGAGASSGAAGALAAGGAAGGGTAIVSVGAMSAGATHVVTLLAAAVVTAGGAVELQHTLPTTAHHHHRARVVHVAPSHPSVAHSASALATDLAADAPPGASTPLITPPAESQLSGAAQTASRASSPSTASQTLPATSTTTTTTTVTKIRATGGISTVLSPGGATPSKPTDGTGVAAGGSSSSTSTSTSNSTPSSTSSTSSSSSTDTGSTQTGQTTSGSNSSGASGSGTSTPPTSSSGAPTDSSSGTSGTGSSTANGSSTGGTPSPEQ
jgi:RNA polymerase sigma factor (sigma-70 family)